MPRHLVGLSRWSDDDLDAYGIETTDTPLVSVGGGLGSFALVDLLRIIGLPAGDMTVVGPSKDPAATYMQLAGNSQISPTERLRSDSGSTIDNPWGFPGYALREAWSDRSIKPALKVIAEPVLSEFFTPLAAQVYDSVNKEADRIRWATMLAPGWVRMIRRRTAGGYFVLHAPLDAKVGHYTALRCRDVHLAVGYPGVKLLHDLTEFRRAHPLHSHRMVNAYEPHEHVYDELRARPCTVVVRGSGIVASRVLQRLIDECDLHGSQTTIVHLFRNYVDGPQGKRRTFRRRGGDGLAYQAFNFPKAAWGGQLRQRLSSMEGEDRASLLDEMGGTTTASRRHWRRQLQRCKKVGQYEQVVGAATSIRPDPEGSPSGPVGSIRLEIDGNHRPRRDVKAAYVIDCTGLLADMDEHRLFADLVAHGGAHRNPKGRLDIDPDFAVRGADSGQGRIYSSGSMTLGGYYAGVDSFLGLQYAALRIAGDMDQRGVAPKLNMTRSATGWWRWVRGRAPR